MLVSTRLWLLALGGLLILAGSVLKASEGPVAISHGKPIDVSQYLVPGKTVIFDFFSVYSPSCPCEGCRALGDPLAVLQAKRDDIVVVKVNINRDGVTRIDWNSPVAMQFGLRSVPHFKVFGPDGRLQSEDDPKNRTAAARKQVHAMIEAIVPH